MIEVKITKSGILEKDLKKFKQQLKNVPKESLAEFKSLTPIRSGNARRKTHLVGDTIHAEYPYAERLDNGWSKQAPRGMTAPFAIWFKAKLRQILGK